MSAKEIVYTETARNLILSGVNALADAPYLGNDPRRDRDDERKV